MTKQQREKQLRYDKAYMRMAMEWAKLSYSQRKQVGAIIVKDRMIISDGYNGRQYSLVCIARRSQCDNESRLVYTIVRRSNALYHNVTLQRVQ